MILLGEHPLKLHELEEISRKNEPVSLGSTAEQKIKDSYERLEKILKAGRPVYGINTGFGVFADQSIAESESSKLSRNIILSHAVATGPNLPTEVVRAAMLVRANTLAQGYSGVRLEVVKTLLDMLNAGVTPQVPSQGSLGSSGDLCLLSHLALVLTTDEHDFEEESGMAEYQGGVMTGKEAMQRAGIKRIVPGPKEGLALTNGATISAALAALNIADAMYLVELGEMATALSLEALLGRSEAFDRRIHEARGLTGQIRSAEAIRVNFEGSSYVDSTHRVQDAYSLRCSPQVHGAVRDVIEFAKGVIEKEINAATDNPLIFEPDIAISGGNFHGEPVGLVMDYLGIALAEVGAISERRVYRLTDGKLNAGLPAMLVDSEEAAGLNSGLMMPQYTAVSLVLENETLATPDSVHSLPTSGAQEDHNANSMTAARHTRQIIDNVLHILSIELYTGCRAVDLRQRCQSGHLGQRTSTVYEKIRSVVPYHAEDRLWGAEIEKVKELVKSHTLLPLPYWN
jgi:histidine ammonia-lyase